jgi:hypothetical protein
MEGAFTHLGNHLVSNSASTIAAGDDESILDGNFGRLPASTRRRRQDDDEETDVFDDEDMESMAGSNVIAELQNGKAPIKPEEDVELPPHACS